MKKEKRSIILLNSEDKWLNENLQNSLKNGRVWILIIRKIKFGESILIEEILINKELNYFKKRLILLKGINPFKKTNKPKPNINQKALLKWVLESGLIVISIIFGVLDISDLDPETVFQIIFHLSKLFK